MPCLVSSIHILTVDSLLDLVLVLVCDEVEVLAGLVQGVLALFLGEPVGLGLPRRAWIWPRADPADDTAGRARRGLKKNLSALSESQSGLALPLPSLAVLTLRGGGAEQVSQLVQT